MIELRTAVELAPQQWQAHQALGRALSAQHKPDDAIADDLTQETMIRAWRSFDRFEGRSALPVSEAVPLVT